MNLYERERVSFLSTEHEREQIHFFSERSEHWLNDGLILRRLFVFSRPDS